MDKKKVKELIEKTICFTKATDDDHIHGKVKSHIINVLQVALEELSKSDWVSVREMLPPCEEVVDVRIDCGETSDEPILVYASTHRVKSRDNKRLRYDKNNFIIDYDFETITHWRKIEKLEE